MSRFEDIEPRAGRPASETGNRANAAALAAWVAILAGGIPATPAMAQPATGEAKAAPVCMARSAADGSRLAIVLPATDQRAMLAKGFAPIACSEAFASTEKMAAYRDGVCEIASAWREDLQQHYERARGERPAVLCGMAEMALEPWERRDRK